MIMMMRFGTPSNASNIMNFLEIVSDYDNLIDAFRKAKQESDWKASVQKFEADLLPNILSIHNDLVNQTYHHRPFYEFTLSERGKTRHIKACDIRDRVIQRCLCDHVLTPTLKPYLIYDNGASLQNKGIDFSRRRFLTHLEKFYRKHGTNGYILQTDFSNFFGSIPHDKLRYSIMSKFNDLSFMFIVDEIFRAFGNGVGLGIGSQISQICGVYYPTPIDNNCKIVHQCKYYGRYMDDIYIMHSNRNFLEERLKTIRLLSKELDLTISEKKTHIRPIDKPILFLKTNYILLDDGRIVRCLHRDTITRERRKLKKYSRINMPYDDAQNAYRSWRGNIEKNYDSYHTLKNMDSLYNKLYF